MSSATPYREGIKVPVARSSSSSFGVQEPSPKKSKLHEQVFKSLRETHQLFSYDQIHLLPPPGTFHQKLLNIKARDQYGSSVKSIAENKAGKRTSKPAKQTQALQAYTAPTKDSVSGLPHNQVVLSSGQSIIPRKPPTIARPEWHPPWKLMRVIAGHVGWVRCLAVEPGNEWFASGSNDRLIKIWDLASGRLKLSLTGHVSSVRGIAISSRQPYLFSCGEDKTVKCWDLEYNKVIRHYHGHLQAINSIALHPTIDVLVTGGRDSVGRVWDMRTKQQIHCLAGHTDAVSTVLAQSTDPQILTASHDSTIKLWDLVAGKAMATLTHHKKSVRSCVLHPTLNMFASGAPDNIKQWAFPEGKLVQNLSGHDSIVNSMAVNGDGVLVSGADNGSMFMWDWRTGYNFQRYTAPVQPGSIESEAGIFALTYDQSGSRLISAEADKTIKMFKEDETATPESHPINWKPDLIKKRF